MNYFSHVQLKKRGRGFTIIETLVAIAILMISIAGPLTIASKGLTAAIYAHDQVIASYLAQDAMEYIKNVKMDNVMNNRPWLDKLSTCVKATPCSVDTTPANGNPNAGLSAMSSAGIATCGSNCVLYLGSTGYTPSSSGSPAPVATKYSRYFYIEQNLNNPNEAKIVVQVGWANGTLANLMTFENEVFNIQE